MTANSIKRFMFVFRKSQENMKPIEEGSDDTKIEVNECIENSFDDQLKETNEVSENAGRDHQVLNSSRSTNTRYLIDFTYGKFL